MTPTIRHLPLRPDLAADYHDNMTPAEVSAWLDQRDRERQRRQWYRAANIALVIIGAALLFATFGFFTH